MVRIDEGAAGERGGALVVATERRVVRVVIDETLST